MSASTSPDPILIVGAGPTGATLAGEQARRGVPYRLIDQRPGPVHTSRAFTLHSQTMHGYAQAGIADRFVERAIPKLGMRGYFDGIPDSEVLDFTQLAVESAYPNIACIEQNVVEQVLHERLAELAGPGSRGPIEWNTELKSVSVDEHGAITAIVVHTDEDNREEIVRPPYLIGCDGLRSTVRTQLGVGFEDEDQYAGQMQMMDVPLSRDGAPASVHGADLAIGVDYIDYHVARNNMTLLTLLPGGLFRMLTSTPTAGFDTEPHTARRAFQQVLNRHFGGTMTLGLPAWCTVFKIWKRVSTAYRRGNIFLVGDAAHIHSPAGGQGMNACIQDAFNLGWKLAAVIDGHTDESLLDTYEAERRPIAKQVIAGTDLLHQVMMAHGHDMDERLAIIHAPGFKQRAVRQISGISYTYRDPNLTTDALVTGDRAPDLVLAPGRRMHDLLGHPHHTLLMLQRTPDSPVAQLLTRTDQQYGTRLRVEVIASPAVAASAPRGAVIAENPEVHNVYGDPTTDSLCLIRPDGYLAARCRAADKTAAFAMARTALTTGRAPIRHTIDR